MADAIKKFLSKLNSKDKEALSTILEHIVSNKLEKYDIKKLTGYNDIFRIRKGKYRIVYRARGSDIEILQIERRSDSTYKDY